MNGASKLSIVIPAKAEIQRLSCRRHWVPAFAGTTEAIFSIVIPAKAGIQRLSCRRHWVPAFAGTTSTE